MITKNNRPEEIARGKSAPDADGEPLCHVVLSDFTDLERAEAKIRVALECAENIDGLAEKDSCQHSQMIGINSRAFAVDNWRRD